MASGNAGDPTDSGESPNGTGSAEADPSLQNGQAAEKKPGKRKPALLAVISICAVLVGAVLVGAFCFNRDFMELIQGKTKYAQNIELATAKSSAGQIVTGLDKGLGFFKNTAKGKTLTSASRFTVKVEDQFLKDMNLSADESASLQRAVAYLNSLKISTKTLTGEKGTQSTSVLTDPSALKLTVDSLIYSDGKTYVHIPEILEKYLSVGDQSAIPFSPYNLAKIKYDPQKLQASLDKLAAIYADSLSAAQVKAENNQSATVDGTAVQGQKLSASLTAAQTAATVKAIAQAAKSDDYLYTLISDNYGLFSAISGNPSQSPAAKLTKEDYGKLIDGLLSKLGLEKNGVTFSAVSYLSRNGTLLAHSYEIDDKTDKGRLNYLLSDKKYTVEFLLNQKEGFTFSDTKTGEGTGKRQLKIQNGQDQKAISVNVEYSGCKTVSFLGRDVAVGKYAVSLYDPDHAVNGYVKRAGLPETLEKLDQSSVTLETALNGEQLSSTIRLSVPGVLSVSSTGTMSGVAGGASIPPQPDSSQVLDLANDSSGAAMNELSVNGIGFLSKTLEKDPELAAVLAGFGISREQLDMLAAFSQG